MGIADRRNHMRHASDVDPFRRDRALETARRNRVFCVLGSRFTANFQSWNSSAAPSSNSLAVMPKTTQGLRHGAQLIPLSQQKMSREIRRASDNATGNALRPET